MHLSRVGIITLVVLIGLSLLFFSEQIVMGLTQVSQARADQQARAASPTTLSANPTPSQGRTPTPTPVPPASPFFTPGNATASALQLPAAHYVLYQTPTHIALVSTTDNSIMAVNTPDYLYSQAVHPILTPNGQLLYTGSHGIWQTDLFDQQVTQIAPLDSAMVIASLALSQDGKVIAWSTEPADGTGQINLYAGPLASPALVSQQAVLDCPCFRIFGFLNGTDTTADSTLLLTDDRGSDEALQYGLWSLDLSTPSATPQLIMGEDSQQGPLALVPYSNTLLYAPYEGAVAVPSDNSVPSDIAALSYANSLSIAALGGAPIDQSNAQVVLPGQKNLASSAQHWVTTPTFSPDGHSLAYIEFSSDTQDPYDRHSALYTVDLNGSGSQVQIGHPKLIATSTVQLLELGPWLNSHVVTLYGDGALYALDVQSGALTHMAQTGDYARILGIVGTGLT